MLLTSRTGDTLDIPVPLDASTRLNKISDYPNRRRTEALPDWLKPLCIQRRPTRAGSRLANNLSDEPATIHRGQHEPTSATGRVMAILRPMCTQHWMPRLLMIQ
jgi:hypothetical protein